MSRTFFITSLLYVWLSSGIKRRPFRFDELRLTGRERSRFDLSAALASIAMNMPNGKTILPLFLILALALLVFQQAALVRFQQTDNQFLKVSKQAPSPPPPPPLRQAGGATAGSSELKFTQNIPLEDKIVTIYETPPELAKFPKWIQKYVSWHQDMRQEYPGRLSVLIKRCCCAVIFSHGFP